MTEQPDISLHGQRVRTLTPEEIEELQAMHRDWLSRQGPLVQRAWGYDPAEFEKEEA